MSEETSTPEEEVVMRTSDFSGNDYPETDDWSAFDGVGWVHVSELDDFYSDYRQCELDEEWHPSEEMYKGYWRGSSGHRSVREVVFHENHLDQFTRCAYDDNLYYDRHFTLYEVAGVDGHVCEENTDHYNYCEHCDSYYRDGFDCGCEGSNDTIREYNNTDYPEPRGVGPWYGVEIEVEIPSRLHDEEVAEDVLDTIGSHRVIIKHDGSLNHGFEIVSAPMSLAEHRRTWPSISDCGDYKSFRSWDTDTCGMHVHVDRRHFKSKLHLARFIGFINADFNADFVTLVAGRSSTQWASTNNDRVRLGRTSANDSEKYVAVSTRKWDTVEVRIFRGTIRSKHILRNLEFVEALINFTLPASRSLADSLRYDEFLKFLKENNHPKQWNLFYRWLLDRKVISTTKKPKPDSVVEPVEEPTTPDTAGLLVCDPDPSTAPVPFRRRLNSRWSREFIYGLWGQDIDGPITPFEVAGIKLQYPDNYAPRYFRELEDHETPQPGDMMELNDGFFGFLWRRSGHRNILMRDRLNEVTSIRFLRPTTEAVDRFADTLPPPDEYTPNRIYLRDLRRWRVIPTGDVVFPQDFSVHSTGVIEGPGQPRVHDNQEFFRYAPDHTGVVSLYDRLCVPNYERVGFLRSLLFRLYSHLKPGVSPSAKLTRWLWEMGIHEACQYAEQNPTQWVSLIDEAVLLDETNTLASTAVQHVVYEANLSI